MKQLTLTKSGARILEINISQKEDRFNPRDSRKWDKIADKLLTAISDYDTPIQALLEEGQAIANAVLTPQEREDDIRRINREIRELDESRGADEVTVILEDSELSFVADIWWTLKFPADRRTRALTSAVSDALEAAIEVKIEDGKIVPFNKKSPAKEEAAG